MKKELFAMPVDMRQTFRAYNKVLALIQRDLEQPINFDKLRDAIQTMTPRQAIYKLLKEELSKRGNWKNLPRGKPDISNINKNVE
jgi:hypothetical protein